MTPDDAAAITALFTSVSEAEQADRASQAATEVTEEQLIVQHVRRQSKPRPIRSALQ